MTSLVLAGSIKVAFLPDDLVAEISFESANDVEFLIGDAPGADLSLQHLLKRLGCQRVSVFFTGERVRNNVNNWPTKKIETGLKSKSSAVHAFKDRAMTNLADRGLMLWDGVSAGTLANIIDLVKLGKACTLYLADTGERLELMSESDLESVAEMSPAAFATASKRLRTYYSRKNKIEAASDRDSDTLF